MGAIAVGLALLVLLVPVPPGQASSNEFVLGTTSALQASGLLDMLVPRFERESGYHVTTIPVSSGQALALGTRGEVEVLLVDAPEEERRFMAAGHGVDRRLVFHDDLVIVGPRSDPADLHNAPDVLTALRQVAAQGAPWVSRGDNSGQYQFEKRLWQEAGLGPLSEPWYAEVGQGAIPTLDAASERQAYTIVDRRAFLERQSRLDLAIVPVSFPELLDLYHVIVVDPAKRTWLNGAGGQAFADFLLAPEAQDAIRAYGVERYQQSLYVPDAGRVETDLVPPGSIGAAAGS